MNLRTGLIAATALVAVSVAQPAQAEAAAEPAVLLGGYQHIGQQSSWWCGPASAVSAVLGMKHYGKIASTRSKPEGWVLTQPAIAHARYLDAVNDGTYRTAMRNGLNRWIGSSWFDVQSNPTPAVFKDRMRRAFRQRYPVLVAALENANGPHYNNHPVNRKVDHWLLARGYTSGLRQTHFVDSADRLWPGVKPYFTYDTNTFVTRWVQPAKAIVW